MFRFIQANIFLYFFLILLGIGGFFVAIVFPEAKGFYAFIAFAAAGGLGVAIYIFSTKKHGKQLVCPMGSDCNVVVNSRYAKFLGIHLEHWGMFYYSLIFIAYILLILAFLFFKPLLPLAIVLTSIAFLFSLYLLFVQAFLLRQWCIWCLLSALLSVTIFIFSLASLEFAKAFLLEIQTLLEAIQNLGFVLGLGGAALVTFLFFRFLRDHKIDDKELETIKGSSEIIWLGLALSLASQFSLFVGSAEVLARSGPFLAQTIALFVVAVSGAVLMIIFTPLLTVIPFEKPALGHRHTPLESLRRPVFIVGSISVLSWFFAFFMNFLGDTSLPTLLGAYVILLVFGLGMALIVEKITG